MIIDQNLTFKNHINLLCEKVSKTIGVLYKLSKIVNAITLKNLYYALIYPHLIYCNLVWGGTFPTILKPLEILQKRSIRLVTNSPFLAHSSPLFKENFILKLSDIHRFRLGVFMHSNPSYFLSSSRIHQYSTRTMNQMRPNFQRLTTTQHSIFYSTPKNWNHIPETIKTLPYC